MINGPFNFGHSAITGFLNVYTSTVISHLHLDNIPSMLLVHVNERISAPVFLTTCSSVVIHSMLILTPDSSNFPSKRPASVPIAASIREPMFSSVWSLATTNVYSTYDDISIFVRHFTLFLVPPNHLRVGIVMLHVYLSYPDKLAIFTTTVIDIMSPGPSKEFSVTLSATIALAERVELTWKKKRKQ